MSLYCYQRGKFIISLLCLYLELDVVRNHSDTLQDQVFELQKQVERMKRYKFCVRSFQQVACSFHYMQYANCPCLKYHYHCLFVFSQLDGFYSILILPIVKKSI